MRLRRFARDERGGIALIAAFSSALIIGFGALAIDMGSVYGQTRKLQGIADLAALAAARDMPNAQRAAQATAAANGWRGPLTVEVTSGKYKPNPAVAAANRFTAGAAAPNAVRVKLSGKADIFFGQVFLGRSTVDISRSATAARAEMASFQLGSRLASLNGGVANSLLKGLTGSSINLSVMDYNQLLNTDVDLFKYLDLLRTELGLRGLSYEKVLQADVTTGKALQVLEKLLDDEGKDSAALAVRQIAQAAGTATPAELDKLISVGPYGPQSSVSGGQGAGIAVSALDLTSATLQLAQEGRQVKLDIGTNVPGVASVDAWLAIGERPNNSTWLTVSSDDSVVIRTAQTRLYLDAKVGSGGLLAGIAQVNLPILVETASAEAKLQSLDCNNRIATLAVKPSVGKLWIGQIDRTKLNDFTHPMTVGSATIADTLLLDITGSSQASIGGASWKSVSFNNNEIKARTLKSVQTDDIAGALIGTLIGNLDLDIDILGILSLSLGNNAVIKVVGDLLTAVAAPLDGLLNTLTGILGVKVGEADVRVNGLRCKEAALVA
ncbi:TadG family pilus assembly protein [Caulobacter mirabilis]|uniref:TadG family pilus assembly protein n=1 Tax=Caulobacter mirabilis TaxID=69666 RepID=UPI001FEBBE44|nr:TadG family pilus assembly protein [Caulobacter mirabilis]